jgi:signal peptidase I
MEQNQHEASSTETQSQLKQLGEFIFDLLKIAALSAIIIIPFRIFIAQPFVVSGSSMKPNFHDHDYLIIDQLSYRFGSPQRGDVVVLKYPKDPKQYFIKRIVALPGEKIKFERGYVVIANSENPEGVRLEEPYLASQVETIGKPDFVTLGTSEYFVLGDNRTASSDSRVWGVLPEGDIVGKAWLRVYPFPDFGTFQHPAYSL